MACLWRVSPALLLLHQDHAASLVLVRSLHTTGKASWLKTKKKNQQRLALFTNPPPLTGSSSPWRRRRRRRSSPSPAHPLSFIRPPSASRRRNATICKYTDHSRVHEDGEQQEIVAPNRKEDSRRKKPFALRLKGRLRLILRVLRNWSPGVLLRVCLRFIRAHLKQVAFWSIAGCTMAVGCLFLKLTAVPSPQVVPYSEFVGHLHARTVSAALFEEGSRQLFFNFRPENQKAVAHAVLNEVECAVEQTRLQDGTVDQEEQVMESEREAQNVERRKSGLSFKAAKNYPSSLPKSLGETQRSFKGRPQQWQYSTRRVENDETYLLSLMRESGVSYSSAPQPMSAALRTVLITIITLWIPLSPLLWLMHRQLSGGNAAAQRRRTTNRPVKFEDVAGVDEAKAELMEIVSCLRGVSNFRRLGAKLPKGILLVGPPGTGKTLLAQAVAGEAGVPFFAASASEFVEMFVGRGAARIRELFAGARKCAPSIIFIDELDAVGGRRGRSFNDERDQTLNQLLTEMDGFESDMGVLVIAATNRPEALDPALCRPGRVSRKVFVKEPDFEGRRQILAVHMRGVPVQDDPETVRNVIATITWGFVGADLAEVVNEAALLAMRGGKSALTLEDFKAAVSRVKYGVGDKPVLSGLLEREISRWFPWIPSKPLKPLQESASQFPMGYQTAPFSN